MHKLCFSILLIFGCVPLAAAQSDDSPRAEFFAGYSVLRVNYKIEPHDPNQPVVVAFFGKHTLNGFNVSATGYLTKGFGLTGDFSGHFKTDSVPDQLGGIFKTKIRVFNILGGPQYKFRNNSRVTPFVRGMAGIAHTRVTLDFPSFNSNEVAGSTDFALAIGGGVDVRVNDRIEVRVFQVDYNPIFLRAGNELGLGNARADNVRFSFGVVFK